MSVIPRLLRGHGPLLRVRSSGHKVVYCPFSTVIHHEGISSGTDLNQGMKKFQAINRVKFIQKWQEELRGHHAPDPRNVAAASARNRKSGILVVDPSCHGSTGPRGTSPLQHPRHPQETRSSHHIRRKGRPGQESYARVLQQMGVEVYATDPGN